MRCEVVDGMLCGSRTVFMKLAQKNHNCRRLCKVFGFREGGSLHCLMFD